MAEGDTIRRTAARIAAALGAEPLRGATAPNPRSPLARQRTRLDSLAGRRLVHADAHGKHLFLRFEGDLTLHCHQGISGRWRIQPRGESWRRPRSSAWVVLSGAAVEVAEFGGPRLALRTDAELAADPRLLALGPDVLGDDFDPDVGVTALRTRAGADRQLGEALLDQGAIAGVGNVYKAEGCFAAKISPWRRLSELTDSELRKVVLETASLMRAGLETGRQPRDVYGRAGRPCPRCGTPVRSSGQGDANRTTFWCPRCQP